MSSDFDLDGLIQDAVRPESGRPDVMIEALTQAWVSERTAPEILPYNEGLIDSASTRLRSQITLVEQTEIHDARTNFKLVIIQTEIERVKYLLRSYLRTRLHKIDRYALHCLRNPDVMVKLSVLERQYVQKHEAILAKHYYSSFVKDLPESGNMRKLDDTAAAGLSMIEVPDLKQAVFCKVTKSIDDPIRLGTESIELEAGNVLLIRYEVIRKLVFDVRCLYILLHMTLIETGKCPFDLVSETGPVECIVQ